MARRRRRSKTIDGGKTSETRRFREVDGALRRAGAGRAHCGDKADCADNRPAPHLSASPTSSPRVRGEGACGRRLLPLAQRAAPHLSASPTSSPRARGEGAHDRGHARSGAASRPSSVGFADIFSPRAGRRGARLRPRSFSRSEPPLICRLRRHLLPARGRRGRVTPSSAAARCGCARGRRRRRAACGIRRASRGSKRSPAPSARRCRPASPRTAAGSLRSFPAPHR